MSKEINILGQRIEPGKNYELEFGLAKLHTRTKIEVPVIVSRAKKDGPCVLISAGIHGNEVNGIEIVRKLIAKKYHIADAGMIICVPVVNVFGFIIIMCKNFPSAWGIKRTMLCRTHEFMW